MVARHVDCRRLDPGQSQEEREFTATWETYELAGDPGWLVTRHRGSSKQTRPRDVSLEEWARTLRTKLITEN